ncbi:hypothetical protein SHIRM173S_10703 [Streptomyces hirsutus]
MTLPAVALVLVFNYLPILGNVVAFQDYDPYISDNGVVSILNSPLVGLNFQRIMEDSAFWNALKNTLVLFFLQLVLFFPIPVLLALLINSVIRPRVRAVAQAILYLPHFFSWVLVIAVFQQLLGGAGIFGKFLRQNGHDGLEVMTNPDTFMFLLAGGAACGRTPGGGSSSSSPRWPPSAPTCTRPPPWTAPDAGAGDLRHVTLPALRPVIALLLVLRVGDALTVGFEQILLQRDAVERGRGGPRHLRLVERRAQPGLRLRGRRRPHQGRGQSRSGPRREQGGPSHGRAGGVRSDRVIDEPTTRKVRGWAARPARCGRKRPPGPGSRARASSWSSPAWRSSSRCGS